MGELAASGARSRGITIATEAGAQIVAPAQGRVVFAGRLESFGHTVVLDHGQGVYSYYLHMVSRAVKPGQRVKRGRLVGLRGSEGVATGPHLHWSLVVGGVRVDPLEWVEREIR